MFPSNLRNNEQGTARPHFTPLFGFTNNCLTCKRNQNLQRLRQTGAYGGLSAVIHNRSTGRRALQTEEFKSRGIRHTCKILLLQRGVCTLSSSQKVEESREYQLQLFPVELCHEQPRCLWRKAEIQAKSPLSGSLATGCPQYCRAYSQGLSFAEKDFSNDLITSFPLKIAHRFLHFRYGFTLHPIILESLQSAINSCCKKTSTYKNFLFDGRATRGLLHVLPASEEAGRWNLSTESCSGSVY